MEGIAHFRAVLCVAVCMGAGMAWAAGTELAQNDTPDFVVVAPRCAATDWDQAGELNAYVGHKDLSGYVGGAGRSGFDGAVCGCDPLAWGQVLVYHALNHGVPAQGWEPEPFEDTVRYGGKDVLRASWPGTYDWEAVRGKQTLDAEGGLKDIPVARLMWNLGLLGKVDYQSALGAAGTIRVEDFKAYCGFKDGAMYSKIQRNEAMVPYWPDLMRRFLRVGAQVEAPTVLQISGHMIVVDGWGVDADGKEWFHVDKGWGSASGRWWDLDQLVTEGFAFYPNVFPSDLGGVIVGRVATDGAVPVPGATVTLSTADGKIKDTATTDANGCYAFIGLHKPSADAVKDPATPYPEVHYTLTVQAEGYADAPAQTVTVESHVDDPTREAKQKAWDEAHKDDKPGEGEAAFFELAYAGAVADFSLTPNAIFVTDGGGGDGRSWETAASLKDALARADAVHPIYLAAGDYALDETLEIPVGLTLQGGHDPATGARDPLNRPTRLTFAGGAYLALGSDATLDGLWLEGAESASSLVTSSGTTGGMPTLRGCVLQGGKNGKAASFCVLVCCLFPDTNATLQECERTHCTFAGTLPMDAWYLDFGGHRAGVGTAWRPNAEERCDGQGHTCPETGLDGRPLGGLRGALGPALPGYRFRIR